MSLIKSAAITVRDRGIFVLIHAVVSLISAKLSKILLGKRFVIRKVNDYKMYLDNNDPGISRSLILFGTRELDHKIMLEKVLKKGMQVLDIGANIGYYVMMEHALIGKEGKVVAIEPSASNIELLKKNLELNGYDKVTVLSGAVSDESGEKEFFLAKHSNLNTFHPDSSASEFMSGESVKVKSYTVPELVAEHGAPDLIRMDVEGHEVNVINGMIDDIVAGKYRPMICFETHPSSYSKEHDIVPLLEKLFENGYEVPYLSSSWARGTKIINDRGYKGCDPIKTDGLTRVIYENVTHKDAIDFIAGVGCARTILLAPKK